MTEKLYKQVDGTEWSWKNLNTVRTCTCTCIYGYLPIVGSVAFNFRVVCAVMSANKQSTPNNQRQRVWLTLSVNVHKQSSVSVSDFEFH